MATTTAKCPERWYTLSTLIDRVSYSPLLKDKNIHIVNKMPRKIPNDIRFLQMRFHVDKHFIPLGDVEDYINKVSPDKWLIGYDEGGYKKKGKVVRPHYHVWGFFGEKDFKQWLHSYGLKGNAEIGTKPMEDEDFNARIISYAIGQGFYKHHGLSPELEERALEMDAKHREREKKRAIFEEMKLFMESQGCRPVDDECEDTPNPRYILLGVLRVVKNVISFYSQRECMSSKSQIEAYSNTFSMRYVQGYKQRLAGQIAERLVGPISEIYN